MFRDTISYDWFALSIIVFLIGLVLVKQLYRNKYIQFARLGFSETYFSEKLKESKFITNFEVLIFTLSHFVLAQFAYIFVQKENLDISLNFNSYLNVLIIFLILTLFSVLKYYFEKAINFSLCNSSFLNYYLFYKQIIWSYAFFLGLPFLIFEVYSPFISVNFFIIGLVLIGLFFIINLLFFTYKNLSMLIKHWFYFILYLCTLEIAPYFFLYKIFAVD
ncbi:DUF4271 domain-containing protein [Flavobacteriaceae bacterium 14752]|uniref:DUF4271 domain-containing protein n=1 Tax=Mesohalobacter salilacus TaxID=2491711 RepID=UPI000F64260C|nr:DUF4271 domain-containing protein [Flavobacteriaceae bacterium 14752]